jgi:hypothetical protein
MPFKDLEQRRAYHRKYIREYRKHYTKTDRWKKWHAKYVKSPVAVEYRKKYNQGISLQFRERRIEERNTVLNAMGGKCSRCPFSDYRALQIDHVNGDGKEDRALHMKRRGYYARVLKSFLAGEGRYQLLCCNCNWIKRCENQEYRKKKEAQ